MKAACRHFRKCSGCTTLQLPYAKQLRDKDLVVREALSRFVGGATAPEFKGIEGSPKPLGYRTTTKLCLNEDTFGQRTIGLYERGTKTVVDIPDCPVHDPQINRLVDRLMRGKAPLPAPFYNHAKKGFQTGRLKFLTLRLGQSAEEAALVVSHTGVPRSDLEAWARGLRAPGLSVYEAPLEREDDDRILTGSATHLAGPAAINYRILGSDFALSPMAFFQANASLTDAFVGAVVADLNGEALTGKGLLDLYGGFGAYGLNLASRFERVWVVDGNASAIAAAKTAAKAAAVGRGFTAARVSVEDFLARMKGADARLVTHAIVNPPRAGLSPQVKSKLGAKALPALTHLTYASCNPQTLARDLGSLTKDNRLKVRGIRAFDMFPQTDHIEVVVKLGP